MIAKIAEQAYFMKQKSTLFAFLQNFWCFLFFKLFFNLIMFKTAKMHTFCVFFAQKLKYFGYFY
jgi:hypothetical protein